MFQSSVPMVFHKMGVDFYDASNSARKAEAAKRLNFYHDSQLERLDEQLNEHFSEPDKMVKVCLNIVKKVINNLAQVYHEPPARTLENGTEKDQDIYEQILESSGFDARMKQAQRYTKLLKTILIRPVWRNDSIAIDVLTPNILDVVTGESPEQLEQVLITDYGTTEQVEDVEYSLWTPDHWQRLDHRGIVVDEKSNTYRVDGVGILPFVPVFDYPPPSSVFWLPGLDDLISLQESVNLKLTDLLYLIQQQSFGVGYIKGGEGGSLRVNPGSLVQLPADGELGWKSQQGEINQVVSAIDKLVRWTIVSNGLSAGSMSTDPTDQSGISKAWDSKELSEMRKDDVALWRGYEKQLFNIARVVHNVHALGSKISDAATLRIDFADPTKQSLTAKEQAQADDLKIAQGVLSPVDVLLRDNPDFQNDREKGIAHLIQLREEMRLISE